MALSEVHNFAAIIGNNGFAVGKNNPVERNINTLESRKTYQTERCNKEYNYWNYNLTDCNPQKSLNLEDDDNQDMNNAMVNDLVSKILDDDCNVSEHVQANRYNGNSFYPLGGHPSTFEKVDNNHDICLSDIEHFNLRYPLNKIENSPSTSMKGEQNYNNLYGEFKSLNLNACASQMQSEQANPYNNSYPTRYMNSYPTESRPYVMRPHEENRVNASGMPLCNDLLTTTNETNYVKQNNWSEALLTSSATDLFGNYQGVQNLLNPDMNFNVALTLTLDSPDSVPVNEMDYHDNIGQNTSTNAYGNPALNMHEMHNMGGNTQSYRPSSAMTDLSVDSGFLSNSPLQHFSPADTTLHNCFGSNIQRNGSNDYKELHEASRLNMPNIGIPNEQYQFLQQQARGYKLDQSVDQDYKHLIDYYPMINDFAMSTNNLDTNENICSSMSMADRRMDNNLLKIISPKSKNIETKTYSPIGFPKNLSTRNVHQPVAKYGYNYQHYTANNGEPLKIVAQNATSYHNDLKQPNSSNSCKLEGFDMTKDIPFPSVSHLANQLAGSSLNKNTFNYIMKQRQHLPRIQNTHGIPAADVLFNSGIIPNPNTVRTSGFPPVMPVPVPVTVPRLFSALYSGGLSLRNGGGPARRTGPSSILHFRLEQTFEQFKQLEKERKKCEAGLAAHFSGKKVTSANNIPIPRLQGNPSRVDRIIIDYLREHARVITLIAKMERLRGTTMNQRVHKAMEYWLDAIKFVQDCRKREIANATKRQKENPPCMLIYNDNDILTLASSVYELTTASRYARTGMYNALQATLLYNAEIEKKVVESAEDPALVLKRNESQASTSAENYSNCT